MRGPLAHHGHELQVQLRYFRLSPLRKCDTEREHSLRFFGLIPSCVCVRERERESNIHLGFLG